MLRFLLEKEFRQIFRDKAMLRIMFVVPVVMLLILPLAANFEVKNISLGIVDLDHSSFSKQLSQKITASGYFKLSGYTQSYDESLQWIEADKADIVLQFPPQFEKDLIRHQGASLFMAVNAINGTKANIGASYLNTIIAQYNQEIRIQQMPATSIVAVPVIEPVSSSWYNPLLDYNQFMVPGILVILVTMIGSFLTALNIVREKEMGTIEQINVTPVRKMHFILGKLIPFWIMGQVALSIGLLVARIAYGITPVGSLGLLYLFSSVYLMAVLGLGLLISTYANTQQQSILISFFLFMIFIMLSGLYTNIDSMPNWAKVITTFNPVAYFIDFIRKVMMKGSSFSDISRSLGIICIFAVVLNTWAILNYRKRV